MSMTPIESMNEHSGMQLFYDVLSNKYFFDTMENIKNNICALKQKLDKQGFVTVNSWYECINQPKCEVGSILAWYTYNPIGIEFVPDATSEGEPYFVLMHRKMPQFI